MAFIKICGLEGKVYVPGSDLSVHKKHFCGDCFSCQMCSDERCALCMGQKGKSGQDEKFCKKGCKANAR